MFKESFNKLSFLLKTTEHQGKKDIKKIAMEKYLILNNALKAISIDYEKEDSFKINLSDFYFNNLNTEKQCKNFQKNFRGMQKRIHYQIMFSKYKTKEQWKKCLLRLIKDISKLLEKYGKKAYLFSDVH